METMITKEPQESHAGERKRLKAGTSQKRILSPRKSFHQILTADLSTLQERLEPRQYGSNGQDHILTGNTVKHTSGLILEPKSYDSTPKTHERKSLDLFVLPYVVSHIV